MALAVREQVKSFQNREGSVMPKSPLFPFLVLSLILIVAFKLDAAEPTNCPQKIAFSLAPLSSLERATYSEVKTVKHDKEKSLPPAHLRREWSVQIDAVPLMKVIEAFKPAEQNYGRGNPLALDTIKVGSLGVWKLQKGDIDPGSDILWDHYRTGRPIRGEYNPEIVFSRALSLSHQDGFKLFLDQNCTWSLNIRDKDDGAQLFLKKKF